MVFIFPAPGEPTRWSTLYHFSLRVFQVLQWPYGLKTPAPSNDVTRSVVPQIAENGNTVPVGFTVDSPMTKNDYVKSVYLFSDKNPGHEVAAFHFSPASGKASASTRMRMIKTQNVIAVAEMSDGSFYTGKKEVKVTIGGCGG